MSTSADRLLEAGKLYFGSVAALAKAMGKDKGTLYSYKAKGTSVGDAMLAELAAVGINPNWISTGVGSPFADSEVGRQLEAKFYQGSGGVPAPVAPQPQTIHWATEEEAAEYARRMVAGTSQFPAPPRFVFDPTTWRHLVVPSDEAARNFYKYLNEHLNRPTFGLPIPTPTVAGDGTPKGEGDADRNNADSFGNTIDKWSHEIAKITRDKAEEDDVRIPLYWQSVPAGHMMPIVTEEVDEFNVSQRYRDTFAVYIRGDSLIDVGIEDDDIAVFKTADKARDGDLVFACVNGLCTLKIYRETPDGIVLQPANKQYEDIRVSPTDNLSIRGILMNIIRKPRRLPK